MPEEQTSASAQVSTINPQKANFSFGNFSKIIIFLLILSIGAFLAYIFFLKEKPKEARVVTGLETEQINLGWTTLSGIYPTSSNPPTVDANNFNDAVFEALTKVRGSSIVPAIATKWTNPDTSTWRFTIRTGIKFQSGDILTVDDVKYSFDQVLENADNEEKSWPSTNSVSTIKEIRIIDDKTVDIITSKPDPILLNRITDVYILSKKQIERDGLDKVSGTGPFKIVRFTKDKKAEVERFDGYWGEKPKLKTAKFIVYETDDDMLKALKNKEIDYARVETKQTNLGDEFQIRQEDEPRVVMLLINFAATKLNGKPNPLLQKNVREAVKLSIDNNNVIKVASVSGKKANQFITKSIVGYNSEIQDSVKDTVKAKALLKDANSANLEFDIYTTADREEVAKAVSAELADSDIKTSVITVETFGSLVKDLFSGKAAAFIAGPTANDGGEYIDGIFRTEADSNLLSYSNSKVDQEIDKINKSFVPTERKKLLESLVEEIVADVPVVPLYSITNTFVLRNNYDFSTNALADFILESVTGREIRNKSY
mgnify:CR=1 FL=1